jgi:hypothetical protein
MKDVLEKINDFLAGTIRTGSLDEFIKRVNKEKCKVITVQGVVAEKDTSHFTGIGSIGNFSYLIEFSAEMPNKKKVVYRQKNFERFGSDVCFGDADDRGKAAILILLLAEKEINNLKEKYQDLKIELMGPDGKAMDEKMFEKLHRDAEQCLIAV